MPPLLYLCDFLCLSISVTKQPHATSRATQCASLVRAACSPPPRSSVGLSSRPHRPQPVTIAVTTTATLQERTPRASRAPASAARKAGRCSRLPVRRCNRLRSTRRRVQASLLFAYPVHWLRGRLHRASSSAVARPRVVLRRARRACRSRPARRPAGRQRLYFLHLHFFGSNMGGAAPKVPSGPTGLPDAGAVQAREATVRAGACGARSADPRPARLVPRAWW